MPFSLNVFFADCGAVYLYLAPQFTNLQVHDILLNACIVNMFSLLQKEFQFGFLKCIIFDIRILRKILFVTLK